MYPKYQILASKVIWFGLQADQRTNKKQEKTWKIVKNLVFDPGQGSKGVQKLKPTKGTSGARTWSMMKILAPQPHLGGL